MSYNSIETSRINELRKIADSLKSTTELNALAVMYALRSMQEVDEEMLDCGEIQAGDLYNREGCYERAMDYINDTVTIEDMRAVIDENAIGDYSLEAVPVYRIERKI